MIYEWDREFTLASPAGTIVFNPANPDQYPRYNLAQDQCDAGWDVRATKSNVPAASGSILRRRLATGVEVRLAVEPWVSEEEPACGAELVAMMDTLRQHLLALVTDTDDLGRLTFTPSGQLQRMLDDCKVLELPRAQIMDGVRTRQQFVLDSPFPYLLDAAQLEETVDGPSVITMGGTSPFYPVVEVMSLDNWVIEHADLGVVIAYDNTRPGAPGPGDGTFIELDFFKNTAFVDGDQADAMPGIVIESSDFFPLQPGENNLDSDVEALFQLNYAWA